MARRSMRVERSVSLQEARAAFLRELKAWIGACIDRYADAEPTDGHDQLTYTTGWEPYLLTTRDERALSFLRAARDTVAAHFAATDRWRHGYWRMQEAHHGTEHFELFLGFMARVLPGDPETARQLVDVTEHLGNWSAEVPDWFDEASGLFRSLFFGADGVRDDGGIELNMPDHLRCVNLLLLSHTLTGEPRYLELADRYARRWADAVASGRRLPIGLCRQGVVDEFDPEGEAVYRSFAGMAGRLDDDLDRAENILASGGVQAFLTLHQHTGSGRYLQAARRLLTVLAPALDDPDAGAAAAAIRSYRRVTGKDDYDGWVRAAVPDLSPWEVGEVALEAPVSRPERPAGIGKRADLPLYLEDGRPRRHSPILLSLAAEITGDQALAGCALDLARAWFRLAVETLPDGRHHGCAAGTVSAVARGHGRDNHAGMTTAVLAPLMETFEIRRGGPV